MTHGVDVIGDIHGQLRALTALGRHLGYDTDDGWAHPAGRVPVFLGDLIDRGPHSYEVGSLVTELVRAKRGLCVLGNHEYNIVAWDVGLETKTKASNAATIDDIRRAPSRWRPVLDFFRELPMAIDLPGLRVIHAVWHLDWFASVEAVIGNAPRPVGPCSTVDWLRAHVRLGSPFGAQGLVPGLATEKVPPTHSDWPHEILIKGHEALAEEPFPDSEGKLRQHQRVTWWQGAQPEVPSDGKVTVFGHYWNLPPVAGRHRDFTPPHPSGHGLLRAWQQEHGPHVPPAGTEAVPPRVRNVCVDYNGVTLAKAGVCVGAYRWPEHQVAWVRL